MQLEHLKSLYLSMAAARLARIAVSCRVAETQVDVAVLAEPGSNGLFIGRDGQWVSLPVAPGGIINPVLPHQDYIRILKMVNAEAQKSTFKTGQFFHDLDAALPDKAETRMVLRTHVAAQLFPQVPEPERLHFLGFQSQVPGASVSEQNLEKTRLLLGPEASDMCRLLNRSSHWSQTANKAVRILPELAQLRKEAERLATRKPRLTATATIAPVLADGAQEPLSPLPANSRPTASGAPGRSDLVMVLVCGQPGSGKSTLARNLAHKLGNAVAIDPDTFAVPMVEATLRSHDISLISPGAAYLVSHLLREGQHAALMGLAFEMLSQGYSPVCAFGLGREPSCVPGLKDQLASAGMGLKIILLSAKASVRRARISGRGGFWDEYNLWHWAAQEAAWPATAEGLAKYGADVLVLDTTEAAPTDIAEQAALFVASARRAQVSG